MKKLKQINCLSPSIILASAALLPVAEHTLAQEEYEASENEEVVEVIGIRRSLSNALDKKRTAENIRDVVNAEDIGKLPDKNVAEALQRVTGVQIGRSFGEGTEISVRGLSQNRVEVNGQTQAGAGSGRGVTFEDLPAEMFESLEVIKTPTADEIEGGLGAIVRLNTRKPLSQKGRVISGSVEASYFDRAEETTPNASLFLSDRWSLSSDAEFGALFNVTHSERKLRQDFFDVRAWRAIDGWGEDLDGNGVAGEAMVVDENGIITDLNDAAFKPEQTRLSVALQDRERTAYRAGFQFKPNEKSEWYIDTSYSESSASDQQYLLATSLNARNATQDFRPENNLFSNQQTVLSGFVGRIRPNGTPNRGTNLNIASNKNPNEREIFTFALSNKTQVSDTLNVYAEFSLSKGEQFNDQLFGSSGVAFGNWPYIQYDFSTTNDIPTLIPYPYGTVEATNDNRLDLTDPLGYTLNNLVFQEQFEENDESAFRLDFDLAVDFGLISELEFGVRYAERSSNRWRNRAIDSRNNQEDGILAGMSYEDIERLLPGSTTVMPFDDILDGASGDFPREWITMNSEYLLNNSDSFKEAVGINMAIDEGWGFDVEETTQAVYIKANFEGAIGSSGVDFSGNFGLRYVYTDQSASGSITQGDGTYTQHTQDNNYDNLLPSLNINFAFDDDLYLRFAAAKTIARPAVADIAPITSVFFFSNAGTTGNINLTPETVTQFDTSLEWYFTEGGILSAAVFYKDFSDAIEDGFLNQCFLILPEFEGSATPDNVNCANDSSEAYIGLATKLNAGDTTLKGIELSYQQSFTELPSPWDGFGLQANYTYTDSDALQTLTTGFQAPLQDFSENSYNAILFYEKYGFTTRLAYNWRDDYYDKLTQSNSAEFAKSYGQLDASINYDFTPKWSLGLSVTNLENNPEERYQEIEERFIAYRVNDTRYALTLRGRL